MADLSDVNAGQTVKIVGMGSTGAETNAVGAKSNNELLASDCINTSASDRVLALTTTAVEVKVGGTRLTNRKYIFLQALSSNVKWGFNTTCNFDLFKNQFFVLPTGNVTVYIKVSIGTGSCAIGEGS
jgi:hypothetical protein